MKKFLSKKAAESCEPKSKLNLQSNPRADQNNRKRISSPTTPSSRPPPKMRAKNPRKVSESESESSDIDEYGIEEILDVRDKG